MSLATFLILSPESAEDPEYHFQEDTEADPALRSLENLQLLAAELRNCGGTSEALERVCDYVVRDPVYATSTRALFRSELERLRAPSA
ncbi:MAG: hypothetical protein ACKO3A_00035 [Opitutia bacterium]